MGHYFFRILGWFADLAVILGALVLLLTSTVLWFAFDSFWPGGWAVGALLLMFYFPNDAQRKGYHDF